MSNVFFMPIDAYSKTADISAGAKLLLKKILDEQSIRFEQSVAVKVHVGEKGNVTFIRPENFDGIVDYLNEQGLDGFFTDTNVLYTGHRTTREKHLKLAQDHGFTRLPMIVADGEHGEDYEEVVIDKPHFKTAKIGKAIARADRMIVLSHFKGHLLAGFGGAIKQLAMGGASRGGKLAMHANAKPFINPFKCSQCRTCAEQCPADAITIGRFSRINGKKCIGCASCSAVCPKGAVLCNFLHSLSRTFPEKLAEYAFAAQKGKQAAYVSFAFNITHNCDCVGKPLKIATGDIGVFASSDPVAIDQACLDMVNKKNGKHLFAKGVHALEYAEKIGLGTRNYELSVVECKT